MALHGSEGDAKSFATLLQCWNEMAKTEFGLELQIHTITGPVRKGRGFAWWSMPPGVRSYNAETYDSFDISCTVVVDELYKQQQQQQQQQIPQYDLILGFSQGAIMITALLALQKITQPPPPLGYVLIGGAWPNPYTTELEESFSLDHEQNNNNNKNNNNKDDNGSCSADHRVLIVLGDQDTINPPEQSFRVKQALQDGGCQVTMIHFDGGHKVPTNQDEETLRRILQWIASNGLL